MKLISAIEIAEKCELKTLGEAYLNIKLHAISLFSFEDINRELGELEIEKQKIIAEGFTAESILTDVKDFLLHQNPGGTTVKKYLLIEVCEREIETTPFDTFEKAQQEMHKRFCEACDIECIDECEDHYNAGVDTACAWANGHENYDWEIVEIV